jgi:mannobiose 2-epimerase
VNKTKLKDELSDELERILSFWTENCVDSIHGGFVGEMDNQNVVNENASKGAILNARILWSFSSAYRVTSNPTYLPVIERAYEYIINHFIDYEFGGVYWELDARGKVLNDRKQIYAIAFTIYALTEYYRVTQKEDALRLAKDFFNCIEEHSFDGFENGYLEAFTRDWQPLEDVRLSDKDENALKTMNTHLHILEAYTNLFRVWQDDSLRKCLRNLIDIHTDRILQDDYHFGLFFDEHWNLSSRDASYGHDIEGSWLIFEAAEVLGDEGVISKVKKIILKMADVTASEGVSENHAVMEELHAESGEQDPTRHWWPQSEGIVGFYNAYQLSGEDRYFRLVCDLWEFTKNNILDHEKGEWFWRVDQDSKPVADAPKVGFWKCPYHNSRACMEIIERISGDSSVDS